MSTALQLASLYTRTDLACMFHAAIEICMPIYCSTHQLQTQLLCSHHSTSLPCRLCQLNKYRMMTWGLLTQAGRRWCLSGTPIQNSVDDLYSCFRFLRYDPYCKRAAFKAMLKDPLQDDSLKGAQLLQVCLKVSHVRFCCLFKLCCMLLQQS